jgi:arylsulfatase A-like enzyme
MLRKVTIAVLVLLVISALYFLSPLTTDEFSINWDKGALDKKKQFLASVKPAETSDSLPNILLILADDLGVNDISLYGNGKVSTPYIDGIARSGIEFDQAYTASPVCSPSRAAILTGRYPQRSGFAHQMHDRYLANRLEYYGFKYFVASQPWKPNLMEKVPRQEDIKRQGLPPEEITIAELLKSRGYVTALIGKWHLGWDEQNKPCRFGFDYQYGFFDSHSLYAPEGTAGITSQKIKNDFTDQYMWKDGRNGPHGIFRNCEPIEEKEHLTDAITRESIDFIRQNRSGPFFLMATYNAPHTPLQAPDRYVEMYKDEPDPVKRVYYAMIKQLDDDIGLLLGELSNLGLLENTLVIFLSDNGGATYTFTTDNFPLRGGKITDFEGGLRIPFFMSWKEKISPGSKFSSPVISMDVFATIAEVAGCSLPSGIETDGKNLLKYAGNASIIPHQYLFWQRGSSKSIRSTDRKVIWNEEFCDTLMFNILSDPIETNNLYPLNKQEANELIRIHKDWSAGLPGPLWPPIVHFREKIDGRWFYFDN